MDELSHLPCDWQKINVSSVADVIDPHPSHRAPDEDPLGIPFAGIGDLDESGKIRGNKVRRVSPEIYEEHSKRYQITANTIGFGRVASIGKIIDFKGLPKKITISPTLALIEPNRIEKNFLIQALKSQDTQLQINLLLTGSTRSSLGIALLRNLIIPFPKLPEQQKIATILSSVDDVIEKTRAQIDKLKDLKTGMMQELLTKGIGHTEFKDSPVGRIPVEWGIKALGEVATVFAGGTPSRSKPEYYGGDVPWVKSGEVNQQLIYGTEETITKLAVQESSARWAKKGAVLVAMYGATAGKVARLMINATLNQAVSAINGKEDKVDNGFLLYAIEYKNRELLNTLQGSGQPNLSGQLIKSLSLPIPPLYEQKKIYAALLSVDVKIERTYLKLNKLVFQKKALMQDLLTGKVRVNLTDKESAVV